MEWSAGRRLFAAMGAVVGFALICLPAAAQAADCAAPAATTRTITTTTTVPVTTTVPTTATVTTTTPTTTTGTPTTTTGTTTTPTTTTPTTTTKTTTTVVRTPARPVRVTKKKIALGGLFRVSGGEATVPDRAVTVQVTVRPYVRGQKLKVTEAVGSHSFKTVSTVARCQANGQSATVALKVSAPSAGHVTVSVSHKATKKLTAFKLQSGFTTLNTNVQLGATGPFVELVQQRLAALHLFIPQTGVLDQGTELALDAYHRLLGQGEGHTQLDSRTINDLLDGVGSFHVRYPGQGEHAEGDLSDQLLALVDGTKVHWILPISSGKPSTPTVLGEFQVYYKEPNYTSDGMYFSSFFHGGYAIHGYNPAPDYPASHGCMRLPMVDAIPVYNWMSVGDWVDTYYT
jgi:hypothetical protein